MTSEEIKDAAAVDLSTNGWLRVIALLLAQLNEKPALAPIPAKPQPMQQGRR